MEYAVIHKRAAKEKKKFLKCTKSTDGAENLSSRILNEETMKFWTISAIVKSIS